MWKIFAVGFAVVVLPMAAAAESDPADLARLTALESRLAALEARLAGDGRNVSLAASGGELSLQSGKKLTISVVDGTTVTSGKTIVLNAGDDILIQAGKSKLLLRKSGVVELIGTDITINSERSLTTKQGGDVVTKGSKIGQN
jgi:hypothetical protein